MKTIRNYFVLSVAIMIAVACGQDLTALKDAVGTLDTDWTAATGKVTSWAENLATVKNQFATMAAELPAIDEAAKKKMKAPQLSKIDSLQKAMTTNMGQFDEIGTAVQSFVGEWTAKADQLEALKSELSAGKVADLAAATASVASLKEAVGGVEGTLAAWDEKLNGAKTACQTTYDMLKGMLPAAKTK